MFPSQGPIVKASDEDASECCGVTVPLDESSSVVPSHDSIQCDVQDLQLQLLSQRMKSWDVTIQIRPLQMTFFVVLLQDFKNDV